MEFRACYPEHIRLLQVQPEQKPEYDYMISAGAEVAAAQRGMAFSGWLGVKCVAAGGVFPQWPGHGIAWLLLSPEAAPEMLRLTRFTKGLFAVQPFRRISITVACDFTAGHRWAKLLGFRLECERMVGYDPAGRDSALYALIRD